MPPRVSALAPLREQTFRRIWTANQISSFGGLVQGVGAAWMMTSLTSSESLIALVQASMTLPVMLFSISAGALADSFDRRTLMLVAQVFMLVVSIALTITAFAGWLTPWTLLGFTFLIGMGTALNNPAFQAGLGDFVPREHLPEAVSLNSIGFNLMRSVGPAIGGIIVAAAGAAAAFSLNALSYVPLIAVLLLWRPKRRQDPIPREAFGPAVAAGLRYVSMSPNLLTVMARSLIFGFGAVSAMALLPLVARDLLQGGAVTYGVTLGLFGLGAVVGGLLNSRIRQTLGSETIVRLAFIGFALAVLTLSLSRSLWFSLPALGVAGACWVLALSLFNVTVQLSSPRWVVGRMLSFYQMATFGGMALGSWAWGAAAGAFGISGALQMSGIALLIGAIIGLRAAMPQFGAVDLDPLDQFKEPSLRLDLRGRSGPIMVMIDYVIEPEDIPEFLSVMADRRRIRRRDGARQWVLLRDLEHADRWTESYHVSTWDDYLRHNMRRTKADAEVSSHLMTLHRGTWPPQVHRMIERHSAFPHYDMPLKETTEHI
ncbi:MAG: MFS transporter [Paracoccaceae bacterium]